MKRNGKNLTSCLIKENSIPMLEECKKCNPQDPKQRCKFYIPWKKKVKEKRYKGNENYIMNPSKNKIIIKV